jgi:hypothetical protein
VLTGRSQDTLSLDTVAGVVGCERNAPKRAPAEGTESEESQLPRFEAGIAIEPQLDASRALRCRRCARAGLGETRRCRLDRGSASSALSAKSGRLLVNRSAFHRQDRP